MTLQAAQTCLMGPGWKPNLPYGVGGGGTRIGRTWVCCWSLKNPYPFLKVNLAERCQLHKNKSCTHLDKKKQNKTKQRKTKTKKKQNTEIGNI